jgi:3-methyladenine DNA glycosylase AlkD
MTDEPVSLKALRRAVRLGASPEKAKVLSWFFKTGPGQYGEGDRFLGVTVPVLRSVAKRFDRIRLTDIGRLLDSPLHEERLLALLVLVRQYERSDEKTRGEIFRFYLGHADRINNWDLVDLTAPAIVGAHLEKRGKTVLTRLARSESLWERRIAIVSTFWFIRLGRPSETFRIARRLLGDREDLIHKATGWMLREAGKRCSQAAEEKFLKRHAARMPRTMLRYAIERFPEAKRKRYLRIPYNRTRSEEC